MKAIQISTVLSLNFSVGLKYFEKKLEENKAYIIKMGKICNVKWKK